VRIVVTSLKGGVGKTTATVYLAAAAARHGHPVRLVDSDPQGSAAVWLEENPLAGVEVVEAPSERLVLRTMAAPAGTVVVVDTPPGSERLAGVAIGLADVVVIPTRVGGVEPARVVATLALVPNRIPSGLVISSARPFTRDYRETVEAWTQDKVDIWGVIPERVGIASGPEAGLHPDGLAAAEDLWQAACAAAGSRRP
jgi:chromosome partitioning protein